MTMNKINLDRGIVTIFITGWDKIFCLKSKVSFAQKNISHLFVYQKNISPPWLRNPGTAIPGLIVAGTYQNLKGRKEFWSTHFNNNTIVIELEREKYHRIVCDLPLDEPVTKWIKKLTE